MGFTLDDIVIDRVQYGFAEDLDGNPLYTLTQLQDATINISAESTDATDNQGNLIKRFWKAKTGEFTANNAMINLLLEKVRKLLLRRIKLLCQRLSP